MSLAKKPNVNVVRHNAVGLLIWVNFRLILSLQNYIFKTDYIPQTGRDIELGFEGVKEFSKDFISQELYPAFSKKRESDV